MTSEQTNHLAACLDHCISERLTLAQCALYLNDQGATTATGAPYTLASLPVALEEIGLLASTGKGTNDARND